VSRELVIVLDHPPCGVVEAEAALRQRAALVDVPAALAAVLALRPGHVAAL
jgi:hypothetical protein